MARRHWVEVTFGDVRREPLHVGGVPTDELIAEAGGVARFVESDVRSAADIDRAVAQLGHEQMIAPWVEAQMVDTAGNIGELDRPLEHQGRRVSSCETGPHHEGQTDGGESPADDPGTSRGLIGECFA